jgi:hypothetical protein
MEIQLKLGQTLGIRRECNQRGQEIGLLKTKGKFNAQEQKCQDAMVKKSLRLWVFATLR